MMGAVRINTIRKFRKSIMFTMHLITFAALFGIYVFFWKGFYEAATFDNKGNYLVMFSYVVVLFLFMKLYGAFKIGVSTYSDTMYSFVLSILLTNLITYFQLCLIARMLLSPVYLLMATVWQILTYVILSFVGYKLYFLLNPTHDVIVICSNQSEALESIYKMSQKKKRYAIKSIINTNLPMDEICRQIDMHEAVFLCSTNENVKNKIMMYCYESKKRLYLLPEVSDIMVKNATMCQIFDSPVMLCKNRGINFEQALVKRVMDIVFSSIGLVVASPFMALIAIAIKAYDKGPVFFKQDRVTKDGKLFTLIKFRSMIVDAEKDGAKKATNDDDRITPVGKLIRMTRVDELPQLINIFKGDMSLVGPRPERIENVEEYTQMLPEFALRHKVKAGLTGYAQIYGKYNTSPKDKLTMDLIYIENYSLLMDIKLMLMTVKIMFMKESTEGFSDTPPEIQDILLVKNDSDLPVTLPSQELPKAQDETHE